MSGGRTPVSAGEALRKYGAPQRRKSDTVGAGDAAGVGRGIGG
jgi:hypothetical protein